jgi:DNA-binding beta-propeller fold protein YncE
MKKIISLLALCFVFVLPSETKAQAKLQYPFAAAQGFTAAPSGTVVVTITNQMSYMSAIPTLTAATTLSLTAASYVKPGAILHVTVKTTATEVTTFAGSVIAPAVTGVSGKTWTQAFIYNGTNFYPCGAKIQVD